MLFFTVFTMRAVGRVALVVGWLLFSPLHAIAAKEERKLPSASSPQLLPQTPSAIRVRRQGADPWVILHEGKIYYTQTTGGSIEVWVADSLGALEKSSSRIVWEPGEAERSLSQNIWAPELHRLRGTWYIYFAADDGNDANHRIYVLESSDGPLGPYALKGKLAPAHEDRWAIDASPFEFNGDLYLLWSGWPGHDGRRQNLYIAKMKDPWSIESGRVLISTPDQPWESWINEGPEVLEHGGRLFVIYSANRSWTDDYRLGMLTFSGRDPLNPAEWKKSPVPVFDSVEGERHAVYGPGHCGFLEDPAAGKRWIIYHVARRKGSGWDREVRAQEWTWDSEGYPAFGHPAPLDGSKV